jgi:DNA mismatch repair protein MutS
VREGPANQSYGLHVAALAGIPAGVIEAARQRLRLLESGAVARGETESRPQLPLFDAGTEHPALRTLASVDPDALTPREALDTIYRLKALANGELSD